MKMTVNNKVAVHGSYFVDNFGDTLLIKLLCDRIAKRIGAENVRLATDGLANEQLAIGYPVAEKNEFKDVSDVFFSGGGYFGEPNISWFSKLRWVFRNYKRHFSWNSNFTTARFHILGVGVGPIHSHIYRSLVGRFLSNCDNVLVRDRESFDYCRKYFTNIRDIDVCVDFALSTPKLNLSKSGIIVHLDTSDSRVISDVLLYLKDKLKSFGDSPLRIVFDNNVSYNENNLNRYREALDKAGYSSTSYIFQKYNGVDDMIAVLSSGALVVTSKLHVGIVTISQGGKVIAIPRHSKTKRLYAQLSLSNYCIEADDFDLRKFDVAYQSLEFFVPDHSIKEKGIKMIEERIEKILSR